MRDTRWSFSARRATMARRPRARRAARRRACTAQLGVRWMHPPAPSSRWSVMTDSARCSPTAVPTRFLVSPLYLVVSPYPFDHLHVSGYLLLDPATRAIGVAALALANDRRPTSSVDVCSVAPLRQMTPEVFLEVANGATQLFANEEEALVLTGTSDAEERAGVPRVAIPRSRHHARPSRGDRGGGRDPVLAFVLTTSRCWTRPGRATPRPEPTSVRGCVATSSSERSKMP